MPNRERTTSNMHFGPVAQIDRPVVGWPVGRVRAAPAAPSAVAISAAAAVVLGAQLVLADGAPGATAGTVAGRKGIVLDVPRAVTLTSSGDDSGTYFLVVGLDYIGYPLVERITGGKSAAVTGRKAFKVVYSITPAAATAGTVSAGTSNTFGLPVRTDQGGQVMGLSWGAPGAVLARDSGTFVPADATTPASPVTGDPRGTYTPSTVANGTMVLDMSIAANADDIVQLYGVGAF